MVNFLKNKSRINKTRMSVYYLIIFLELAFFIHIKFIPEVSVATMVMPGLLSENHAEFENNCSKCHASFNDEQRSDLCKLCHENIEKDILRSEGFHGRSSLVSDKSCDSCHTEHNGRDAQIISFDESIFDHNDTDFVLIDAHKRIGMHCYECHEKNEKFRYASSDCFDCHSNDDVHQGKLGLQCKDCHKQTSWNETYFSHDKTSFPLQGKHKEVGCDSCHPDNTYSNLSTNCNSCHIIDDIHNSKLEERCDKCHNTENWQTVTFEHNSETDFILRDSHLNINCDKCHLDLEFVNNPDVKCINCHFTDDIHKTVNNSLCNDCHNETQWNQVSFNHNEDTDFKLTGQHIETSCISCHMETLRDEKPAATCYGCHKTEDVHKGQLGSECDSCHNTTGWNKQVIFDHDLTLFPLIGFHAAISCDECHVSYAYKDTQIKCVSCHEKEDGHEGTLGTDCENCHNPNGWMLWQFDHNSQTKFKADGAHKDLACSSCHDSLKRDKSKTPRTCYSCHAEDDVHFRKFGKQCERCHITESFHKIITGQ